MEAQYDILKIASDWGDIVATLTNLLFGAVDIAGDKIYDPTLNESLILRRTLQYETLGGWIKITIGSNGYYSASHLGAIVGYTFDDREPNGDIFIIYPNRLANYLPTATQNTRKMTGDDEPNAISRVLFSFAFHEIRHSICHRDKSIKFRNLEDAVKDTRLPFANSAEYMRLILASRTFLLNFLNYSEKHISLEQRKKYEEDAFIAEAIGFHYYPLYRDRNFSELSRVLKSWLLQ